MPVTLMVANAAELNPSGHGGIEDLDTANLDLYLKSMQPAPLHHDSPDRMATDIGPIVDSHCHLDLDGLHDRLDEVLGNMRTAGVVHALCVSVTLEDWPRVAALAERHPDVLSASVGVHPDAGDVIEPTLDDLVSRVRDTPGIVAIGETGVDHYRLPEDDGARAGEIDRQEQRFRTHIRAARETGLPLIIHTRAASETTIRCMREEGADQVGGVMHCFTESWDVARAALDLGFHISFSGIVTFKNAADLRDVARRVPADRLLIETDSPYLAPVPFRGKTNEPAWVAHVARCVADLRGVSVADIAATTTHNFGSLFRHARLPHAATLHPSRVA